MHLRVLLYGFFLLEVQLLSHVVVIPSTPGMIALIRLWSRLSRVIVTAFDSRVAHLGSHRHLLDQTRGSTLKSLAFAPFASYYATVANLLVFGSLRNVLEVGGLADEGAPLLELVVALETVAGCDTYLLDYLLLMFLRLLLSKCGMLRPYLRQLLVLILCLQLQISQVHPIHLSHFGFQSELLRRNYGIARVAGLTRIDRFVYEIVKGLIAC